MMLKSYVHHVGLPESAIEEKTTWKPGFFINVPGDGKYVINTEPVTVEFNTTQKLLVKFVLPPNLSMRPLTTQALNPMSIPLPSDQVWVTFMWARGN